MDPLPGPRPNIDAMTSLFNKERGGASAKMFAVKFNKARVILRVRW